jgi:predicted DNA-binding WGR domain protein
MDDLLNITLEAHHAAGNHHRWYSVSVGIDLLHHWSVRIRYGRCGSRGQERHFAGSEIDLLRKVVRDHLRRRLSAPERIGCAYRIIALNMEPGFDAASWLPDDLMAKFFASYPSEGIAAQ